PGHFLLEEDDKFLDKEERQALAAADTDAAKGAIATAESVATFFSQVMVAIGENTAGPGVLDIEFRESVNEQRRRMIEVISG
uniref:Uncharacterized protein n=1 Tax=Cucumis melo TaxID=3656 RepID=A0A9I9E9X3_CUCME